LDLLLFVDVLLAIVMEMAMIVVQQLSLSHAVPPPQTLEHKTLGHRRPHTPTPSRHPHRQALHWQEPGSSPPNEQCHPLKTREHNALKLNSTEIQTLQHQEDPATDSEPSQIGMRQS
jgi:hypothetical protein